MRMKFEAGKYVRPLPARVSPQQIKYMLFWLFVNAKILAADIGVIYSTGLQRIVFQYLESVIIGKRWAGPQFSFNAIFALIIIMAVLQFGIECSLKQTKH